MRFLLISAVGVSLFCAATAYSQTNDINRQNRTIEVVVSETVKVEPDVAVVTLGCISYGETHDQAYQANLQTADTVIAALLKVGVSKDQIESNAIELNETNPSEERPRPALKGRQFAAHQSWNIRVAASDAQKIIDIAVQAGANGIEDVNWEVSDADALEVKARAAAMKKARITAEEIAESTGGKVGELLYASNVLNGIVGLLANRRLETTSASVASGAGIRTPTFSLKLFPAKIEKEATVRAIFALD